MSRQNLYKEDIIVSDELNTTLKKYLLNHLIIYNYALNVLEKNSITNFKELKKILNNYIKEKGIEEYIPTCLYSEIHYLYKKYNNNCKKQKQLSKIQYLTFYINSYNNKVFNLINDNRIVFKNLKGYILLNKSLPVIKDKEMFYLNISYSSNENRYQLSIYK